MSAPTVLDAIATVIAIKKVKIMGVGVNMIYEELIIMLGMTLLFLGIALKKFKIRLS